MGSDIYKKHTPASGGGGQYLKILDGETVRLRLSSEPAIFETVGEREGKETLTTRYGWVVYNQDKKIAQVLQQSGTFFKSIAAYAQDDEWGDPTTYDIKITRSGSGFNDTTYSVMPSNNKELLDLEADKAVKSIDLISVLSASPFSQKVFWLSEFEKDTKRTGDETSGVDVIADVGDGPINLDHIPF